MVKQWSMGPSAKHMSVDLQPAAWITPRTAPRLPCVVGTIRGSLFPAFRSEIETLFLFVCLSSGLTRADSVYVVCVGWGGMGGRDGDGGMELDAVTLSYGSGPADVSAGILPGSLRMLC